MQPKKLFKLIIVICVLVFSSYSSAQNYQKPKSYTIAGIEVTGLKSFNEQTVVSTTGLRVGQQITIPGEEFSNIIKKLYGYKLFSDVQIYYYLGENEEQVFLEINVKELPKLSDFKIVGIKDRKKEDLIKDAEIKKGKNVTESFLVDTKNYIVNKYKKDGYANAKVTITTKVDTSETNAVKMLININRGDKVKIKKIEIVDNEKISDAKLRAAMKNTKQRAFLRFWKKSKYLPEKYEEDLIALVDKYKENGYRDARIISDSVIYNEDNTLTMVIKVFEGDKYYFGDIEFIGNNVYSDETLSKILGIKKGDVYNGVLLKERIADKNNPDADDITNLYQNSGYLFSNINPVEISAKNDTINFEIRILEGKPAYFNHVTVSGNDRTNDHVVYRELRTRPGELYQKSNVVRTIRELSQLGFFDPQQINPEIINPDANAGTVDVKYTVVEKGSSQVQLQGGYGGGGFIGTLGLSFNNFSLRNIFNKNAYRPLPMGDGQSLSLRLQASKYYQTYNVSFAEPWLGGKEPKQLSVSLNHTIQYGSSYNNYGYYSDVDKSKKFLITGISIGLSKRLRVPDDFFNFSQAISFQHYNLKNYSTYLFNFNNGNANSLAYTIGLSRRSSGPNPIFPMGGSDFSLTAKMTLPYSLFEGIDYKALAEERDELEASGTNQDRIDEIDQMRIKWLEFYKIKFSGNWYTKLVDKFVLKTGAEFGFLGSYNSDKGVIPFERFYVGGDGMANYTMDGRENIQLRGYQNQSLSSTTDGSVIYNKFSLELRYPITLSQQASIYGLTFLEGGTAYDNFRDFNPFQLKRSAGFGLRIFMPAFGLLGIDFGYGFDSVDGTNNPSGWQTHFIIGQQF